MTRVTDKSTIKIKNIPKMKFVTREI